MSTYRDFDLTFKPHPGTGDCLKKTDVNAVKASLKNILFGGPFDVPFNPTYGGSIRNMLFELSSPALFAMTKRKILLAISEFEPRAEIEDLYVNDNSDNNALDIGVLFYVKGNPQKQTLNYSLTRVS